LERDIENIEELKMNMKYFYDIYYQLVNKYIPEKERKNYFYTKEELEEEIKKGQVKFI